MKKLTFFSASVSLLVLPLVSSAATQVVGKATNLTALAKFVDDLQTIFNTLIPVLVAAGVIVFFWGLVRYMWGKGGHEEVEGKKIMIAGLVAIFIMVCVWGIVKLIGGTLGINENDNANPITTPTVK